MTTEQIANESIQRTREADDDAALAAEAFAFGMGSEYVQHRQAEIARRLRERYGDKADSDGGSSGATG